MIIYKITNRKTKKSYIGQTTHSLNWRWKKHYREKSYHDNHFSRALKKYEREVWYTETIEEVFDSPLLNERERYWIEYYDTYRNGYNSTTGGECGQGESNPFFGKQHSNESKRLISKNRSGIPAWNKGKTLSADHIDKLSLSHVGKVASEETKKKHSKRCSLSKWWNDGIEERFCTEPPNNFFRRGRLRRSQINNSDLDQGVISK